MGQRRPLRLSQTTARHCGASLRGIYKRNEYRKVILSLTVLRHFDCVLADTNQAITPTLERMEP